MDNIYNNYRNIIERAVLAGIITEENKQFYLSAIHEENESEISELETQLITEEAKSSNLTQENRNVDIQKATCSKKNTFVNKQNGMETINTDECKSNFSEHTIENYSIFDIKDSKYNDFTDDSYSEISSISQNVNLKSTKKMQLSNILSKVVKKPKQNRIIDFNIPIYIDIKKRKSTIKPITSNTVNVQPCESSKVCACKPKCSKLEENNQFQNINYVNCEQCESSKVCTCKVKCSKHKENRQVQNANKYSHPKAKVLVASDKINSPLTNFKTFNDLSTLPNQSNELSAKINEFAFQKTDFSVNRRSVYTFPPEKEIAEEHKENPGLFSQYLEGKIDKNARHCANQKHAINSSRKFRIHEGLGEEEHKYKQKIKNCRDSYNYPHSHENKRKSRSLMHVMNKTSKCKHCKCDPDEQVFNNANNIETSKEDGISAHDAPFAQNSHEKDCDRFLNVNIFCQFYQEEDAKKQESPQEPLPKKNDASIEPDEKEKNPEYSFPNEKTKKNNKIQRLSKLFTNMKIKRKQNEAEFHP